MNNNVNHAYNRNSSCYNFLFHPLHEKSKKGVAITFLVIATISTFGIWQIPFLIINRRDQKKLNLQTKNKSSKTQSVSLSRFHGKTSKKNPKNSDFSSDALDPGQQKKGFPKKSVSSKRSFRNTTDSLNKKTLYTPILNKDKKTKKILSNFIPLWHCLHSEFIDSVKKSYADAGIRNPSLGTGFCLALEIDSPFINIKLKNLIDQSIEDKIILDHPERKDRVERVQRRIQELDDAIQLKNRIEQLDVDLTVADLFKPWDDQQYLYLLVMDDELAKIKASDFPPDFHHFIPENFRRRFEKVATQYDFSETTAADLKDIPAVAFCSLDARNANRLIKDLPLIAFFLMPDSKDLDVASLSKSQADALFIAKKLFGSKSDQIES